MTRMLSFIYQKKVRDIFWQAIVLLSFLGLMTFFVVNASRNMRDAGIASGFDFLFRTAGIEIPFVLTNYTAQSDNLSLLWVGIVNTMLISPHATPSDELFERTDSYYIYLKPYDVEDREILREARFDGAPPVWIPMPPH